MLEGYCSVDRVIDKVITPTLGLKIQSIYCSMYSVLLRGICRVHVCCLTGLRRPGCNGGPDDQG